MRDIKSVLDRFYREYNFRDEIINDPIRFPLSYDKKKDMEISGFVASCFAYGKVGLFMPVIEKILSVMGRSPYDFVERFNVEKHEKLFDGIKYRFNGNRDIICLLHIMHEILKGYKSMGGAFKVFYNKNDVNIGNALAGFIRYILSLDTTKVYGRNMRPVGLLQFFPSPENGSACKRMNMFLRWMIRDKDIDLGIWKGIPMDKLVIPLDTHIARISRCLGFTKRKSNDWKTAVEITNALKGLDPEDPLKYDFVICHYGISGLCGIKSDDKAASCKRCVLKP